VRLLSYRRDGRVGAGALAGPGLIDLWAALGSEPPACGGGLRSLLEAFAVAEIEAAAEAAAPALELAEVEPLPPVPDPEKIVCIGLNYGAHAEEAGLEPPAVPTFFAKFANALVPDGATVRLPAASAKVDFEAEVAFVIGREAREIEPAEALAHVAGFTLLNDLSARDLQFATPQWIPGKVFDGSAPCGPWLVTPSEAGPPDRIGIALELNGERMQEANTADLIFAVPELVAHLSTLMTLVPGDIVSTGTPAGVGSTRTPRVWLADGDELEVSSPQLGRLRTRIAR
jgi:2-keto-4-pentenoate hydratase/2-oxohepta-3-ene-1,7-dioic acid hydratase in catechol pathway